MKIDFSVIVPTFDRPTRLRACLRALAELEYPRTAYEVLVVDDGGAEPLDRVVADLGNELQLSLIRQPNAGPATARNTGAAAARGRYLAFTDDDCAPERGWLIAMGAALRAHPNALVGGRTVNALADNPFSSASQQLISYHYRFFNDGLDGARFLCSNNWAVAAGAFNDLGGFDSSFRMASGEDIEFCDRWVHSGRPLRYAPGAVVRHAHDLSLRGFLKQQFDYGRGSVQVQHRLGGRKQRGRRKGLAFYAGIFALALSDRESSAARRLGALTLLGLSQIANATGYRWEANRTNRRRSGSGERTEEAVRGAPDGVRTQNPARDP